MREIRFRAYRKGEQKPWNYYTLKIGEEVYLDTGLSNLGQFTGLHDKNGKEIYEGDIIIFNNSNSGENWSKPVEIVWREDNASFDFHYRYSDGWSYNGLIYNDYEVVGNIYQNPELIK